MKFGEGEDRWKRFFSLMSSVFAIMESCPVVNNTPSSKSELFEEISELAIELNALELMNSWAGLRNFLKPKEAVSFILILNTDKKEIKILSQKKRGLSR